MSSRSYAPYIASIHSLSPVAARRRLSVALAASVAMHFWLVGALSGGAPPPRGKALQLPSIAASLEHMIPAPVPAAPLESPDSLQERAQAARARQPAVAAPRSASSAGSRLEHARIPDGSVREAPDETYYAARQLDVFPALMVPLDLPYPRRALDGGVEGRALLLLRIDATGVVEEVTVVEAQPAGYFEEDARRSFLAARFSPGQRNGQFVKSRVLVEVNYGERSVR